MLWFNRGFLIIVCCLMCGCQVKPLYQQNSLSPALRSVEVLEANTRYGQEVRNHFLFLTTGGGKAQSPLYTLDLGISAQRDSAAHMAFGLDEEIQPSAGRVTLTSVYTLKNTNGAVIASGKRSISSSFDRNLQQFSNLRAERDGENRAARELAELVYADITLALSKY